MKEQDTKLENHEVRISSLEKEIYGNDNFVGLRKFRHDTANDIHKIQTTLKLIQQQSEYKIDSIHKDIKLISSSIADFKKETIKPLIEDMNKINTTKYLIIGGCTVLGVIVGLVYNIILKLI